MASRLIPPPSAPTTLLPHLLAALEGMKRTRVKELLTNGLVHVNEQSVTRHDHPVGPSDKVEIRDSRAAAARQLPFPVLFEDDAILVINKPSGLLSIATPTEKARTVHRVVNDALAATRERAFIVHRLDRFTSGALLLAKSEDLKNKIMDNWKEAEKIYFALVEGTPNPPAQTLVHHLHEDEQLRVHALKDPRKDTQRSVLHFRVDRVGRTHSLLRVELETGRKNQIRAQMSVIGHPVAGDAKYGATTDPIGRLALHAASLSIPHPVKGTRMKFEAAVPEEFLRFEQTSRR